MKTGHGRMIRCAVAVACLAGMTGCMLIKKTSGTEVIGVLTEPGQEGMSRAIIVNNAKLGRALQVVDIRHDFVGEFLRPSVILASKYAATLQFQYKFSWYDETGLEVHPNTDAWTPVVLHGNQTMTVQAVAPHPSVKSFKLNIRN